MSGLFGGLLWFLISTIVSWLSIYCLYVAANRTKKYTYGELAQIISGRKAAVFSEIVFVLNNFGTCTSYMVLVSHPANLLNLDA
jgi:amino acid permease